MKESQQSYQRYPRYFRVLRTLLVNGIMKVSSVELARHLNITPSTVRADLNRFSGVGQQGYGYNVKLLYTGISRELGAGDNMSAVIIGGDAAFAKRLAERFEGRGVTVSCFVPDIGEGDGKTGSCPITEISQYLSESPADIAVIVSLPEGMSADTLVSLGIKGIWNMTQNDIIAPVPVINLPVGDIIMNLCYEIRRKEAEAHEL